MNKALRVLILTACAALLGALPAAGPALAQGLAQAVGPVTGLPLPRFVSLKADKVAIRRGPSKDHEIRWIYQRSGLPVEIIAEFENWRRVRDSDGSDGWVYHSLLTGRRMGLVTPRADSDLIPVRRDNAADSHVVAKLEPGVLGRIRSCDQQWCRITVRGYTGFVEQVRLWGVYPDERVN